MISPPSFLPAFLEAEVQRYGAEGLRAVGDEDLRLLDLDALGVEGHFREEKLDEAVQAFVEAHTIVYKRLLEDGIFRDDSGQNRIQRRTIFYRN